MQGKQVSLDRNSGLCLYYLCGFIHYYFSPDEFFTSAITGGFFTGG